MCGLNNGDLNWVRTFPHIVAPLQDECIVAPLQDEWLLGLLWRCDQANGWPKNTTKSMVLIPHSKTDRVQGGPYVLGEYFDLDKLAKFLEVSIRSIEETTFRAAHFRLNAKPNPIYIDTWGVWDLKICPSCMSEGRLIRKFAALPYVNHCPIHKLVLQDKCSCGTSHSSHKGFQPFTCHNCGLDWGNLPREEASPRSLALEERYLSLYTYFLTEVTGLEFRRVISWLIEEHWDHPSKWRFIGWRAFFLGYVTSSQWEGRFHPSDKFTLPGVVHELVEIGTPVRDIALIAKAIPRREHSCLNHACSLFGITDANNIAFFGYYQLPSDKKEPIWWCKECGSCYINYRLCFSFDKNSSRPVFNALYPPLMSTATASWELKEWKKRLQKVCRTRSWQGKDVEIKEVLEEAKIPWKPNLLATRLGLVQIIQEYAHPHQKDDLKDPLQTQQMS